MSALSAFLLGLVIGANLGIAILAVFSINDK